MRRCRLTCFFLLAVPSLCQAQPDPTPADVLRSMDQGISYLKSQQRNGRWPEYHDYVGGMTALCALSLLSCDVPADDPVIQDAIAYLRTIPPSHTYVVALQTMVFAEVDPKTNFPLIRRNAEWLIRTQLPNGAWSYGNGNRGGAGDNSNTQYALLGVNAAADAGYVFPDNFWEKCRQHWLRTQAMPTGSWGYSGGGPGATASMTVAGISSLVITGRQLLSVEEGMVAGKRVRCKGIKEDQNLQMALDWMGRNMHADPSRAPDANSWVYYYLYGVERAGRLSGRRFFGDHDWYRVGVRYLLRSQHAGGAWNRGAANNDNQTHWNTAFALLFLSKGKIPILINKLKYDDRGNWNKAPNDINNLTAFMAGPNVWDKKLNWQIVDVDVASVEDLLQAPILHMNGHYAPELTGRQKQLIREYVSQGGLLVADANCSVPGFDQGFRALCKELFPEEGQELKPLDAAHGVWNSLFPLQPNTWPLEGIDVGCRTVVFYSPEDLSCQWEHARDPNSLAAFRMGANIVAYATGPEDLRDKLERRQLIADFGEDEIKRGFLQIAKIRHNGDWNPAPRAIPNLLNELRDFVKVDVVRQQRPIDLVDPNLLNYPLAYMHGRTRFQFTDEEIEILKSHLELGGVLFADACCGSNGFDEAFRAMTAKMFPEHKLQEIPPDHEIFSQQIGHDLSRVKYSKALGGREGIPHLEGIEIDGRYVLIYSKYDLGCALERQQSSDCKGYDFESAVRIATNVVLYALQQ